MPRPSSILCIMYVRRAGIPAGMHVGSCACAMIPHAAALLVGVLAETIWTISLWIAPSMSMSGRRIYRTEAATMFDVKLAPKKTFKS